MIDEMRGGLRHTPSIAGRTDAASFAGKGDKKITPAIRAVGAGKSVSEDTAFQVASDVPLDIGRHRMSAEEIGEEIGDAHEFITFSPR